MVKIFLFIFLFQSILLADSYVVQLGRNITKGDEYIINCTGSLKSISKRIVDGDSSLNVSFEDTIEFIFHAKVSVIKLHNKGGLELIELKIHKLLSSNENKEFRQILKEGTVVRGSYVDGQTIFSINGQSIDEEANQALAFFISLGEGAFSDDNVVGTNEKKKIGEKWSFKKNEIVKSFGGMSKYPINNEDVSGEISLKNKVTVNDVECLDVIGKISIKNIRPYDLEKGTDYKSSVTDIAFSNVSPINLDLGMRRFAVKISSKYVVEGRSSPDYPMNKIISLLHMEKELNYQHLNENK